MKTLIILATALVLTAGPVYGQAGYIGLFSDPNGFDCEVIDGSGLVNVYAVHMLAPAATYSQWRVQSGGGFGMIWIGDTYPFICIDCGNSQDGILVSYLGCQSSPYAMMSIQYLAVGTSATCSYLDVVADPDEPSGEIVMVDCSSVVWPAGGSRLYVNPDMTCQCGPTVPVDETSWGKIKAMYTE